MPESPSLIPVEIVALVEEQMSQSPIIVLHDRKTNRVLPIWIGDPEARAIAVALNNVETPRPLTHQLFISVIDSLGAKISRIVIDKIKNHTYFATMYFLLGEKTISVDARPSDAIALALTARVPIFVASDVMDQAGQMNPFPVPPTQQEKREPKQIALSKEELDRIKELLKKAREREQMSGPGEVSQQ